MQRVQNRKTNNGRLEYNIKERMNYKGISKPYKDFDMEINKIIIGNKCSVKTQNEVLYYGENNNIPTEFI